MVLGIKPRVSCMLHSKPDVSLVGGGCRRRPEEGIRCPAAELQVLVSYPKCVPGTELPSCKSSKYP